MPPGRYTPPTCHHPHTHNSLLPPPPATHTHPAITTTSTHHASLSSLFSAWGLFLPPPTPHLQLISGSPGKQPLSSSSLGATLVLHLHLQRGRPATCSAPNRVKEAELSRAKDGKKKFQWLLSSQIMARMGPGAGQTPAQSPQEELPDSRHHMSGPKALSSFWASPVGNLNQPSNPGPFLGLILETALPELTLRPSTRLRIISDAPGDRPIHRPSQREQRRHPAESQTFPDAGTKGDLILETSENHIPASYPLGSDPS